MKSPWKAILVKDKIEGENLNIYVRFEGKLPGENIYNRALGRYYFEKTNHPNTLNCSL